MASFPFTNAMLIPHMPFVFTCLSRNRYTSFYASIDMSMLAQYRFHVYSVVNPKRVLEFKMAGTVGLKDISSIYIPYEVSCVMYLDVLQTYSNDHFESQLSFCVNNQINIKSILCRRRRVYAGIKRGISIP